MTDVVLCVGAEKPELVVWKWTLEAGGYTVVTAVSGPEAVGIFASMPVRVAILDNGFLQDYAPGLVQEMQTLKPQVPLLLIVSESEDYIAPRLRFAVDAVCSSSSTWRLPVLVKQLVQKTNPKEKRMEDDGTNQFTRSRLGKVTVSVCQRCLVPVGRATTEEAMQAAEHAHRCRMAA